MSDVGKAFRTYLLTKSGVTSLIGSRIYPDNVPQGATMPAIVYHVVSDIKEHYFGGATRLATARVQLDLYAVTREGSNALAEATRNAADGYRGAMGDEFAQMCHLDTQRTDTDEPRDGSDLYRYVVQQDWLIALTESTPTL